MRDSKARLVTTAIVAASRFPFPRLYRSPGTPIGKSIDYLDFATIELPGPAYGQSVWTMVVGGASLVSRASIGERATSLRKAVFVVLIFAFWYVEFVRSVVAAAANY